MRRDARRSGFVVAAVAGAWGVLAAGLAPVRADVKLPHIIGSNMVIQCDAPVNIWGTADAGEDVSVTLAGQEPLRTTAGADGKWLVKLPPQKAGATVSMMVQGKNTLQLDNILVGEVWICTGQSNMELRLAYTANAEQAIAAADHPTIRLFVAPHKIAEDPQDDTAGGSWVVCTPQTARNFSAVGYYFGVEIQEKTGQPVGLIGDYWGGTWVECWTALPVLQTDPDFAAIWQRKLDYDQRDYPKFVEEYEKVTLPGWQEQVEKAKAAGQAEPRKPVAPAKPGENPRLPAVLYNGMLHPVIPYTLRGAIWYQGEGNAANNRSYQYRRLLPLLIKSWRAEWGQGDFPFGIVQLANYQARKDQPGEDTWAELREAQLMTAQNLTNTGLAVTIDVGDANDIHPKDKKTVGQRLALWAWATVYGHDIPYSGPIYRGMEVKGDSIVVSFDHTDGGLKTSDGGRPTGFAIAGGDHKFVWADAIIAGDTVVVHSDQVPQPVAVRYAWARNPQCNLINGAELPASPFRSDDWPGLTDDTH